MLISPCDGTFRRLAAVTSSDAPDVVIQVRPDLVTATINYHKVTDTQDLYWRCGESLVSCLIQTRMGSEAQTGFRSLILAVKIVEDYKGVRLVCA